MPDSYDLTKLNPDSFEHLVNALAIRVLGTGHTGFGPGPDGGRDGFFEGEAPYPSLTEKWSGKWFIQSKFHKPHLSKNAQTWLVNQISDELKEFRNPQSERIWPDNWIVATNIDPSGTPKTGSFDQARKEVLRANSKLANRFHIWGGRKILDLLAAYPDVAEYYAHFLTPGHVLTSMYDALKDDRASIERILRFLIVQQFDEQQYTKLDQAGSDADNRPGIHRLFIDLPFHAKEYEFSALIARCITKAAACCHIIDIEQPENLRWRVWRRHPNRARIWFVKGGPGQGKSTIGQYISQIQRAALILNQASLPVLASLRDIASEVKLAAEKSEFWSSTPRIPIYVELKDYAQWLGTRAQNTPRGLLTFLSERIANKVEQPVAVGTLKRALGVKTWIAIFDGLDEVPDDAKDEVALAVKHFANEVALEVRSDLLTICTSRPQGYSGQFADIDGATVELLPLEPEYALRCAVPVIKLGRSPSEGQKAVQILESAIESGSVRELMTTPLQSHIMAVVVRDGGRPPDRRWQLFNNFYQVIKRREANRDLPDREIAKLLREDDQLLKAVHNRLGFTLHSRAETSAGARTSLNRSELTDLVNEAVDLMIEGNVNGTVAIVMRATTDRLVLVNTPDDGAHVRFDIRQLQEFFAAEFLYEGLDVESFRARFRAVCGDAHWREAIHFVLSALIENSRQTELDVAIQILDSLNESNASTKNRLLSRRLAFGALPAFRLLQEGVFEQDKRTRQQFKKCLEPIAGLTYLAPLAVIKGMRHGNSKTWFLSYLFERIFEADKTESVGACGLLIIMLQDDDPRLGEFREFLLNAPQSYAMAALSQLRYNRWERSDDEEGPQEWVRAICLSFLLRDQWTDLTQDDVAQLISVIDAETKVKLAVASKVGLTATEVGLLSSLLNLSAENQRANVINYGVASVHQYEHSWLTDKVQLEYFRNQFPHDAEQSRGILQLVYRIIKFAKTKSRNNLVSVFDFIDNQPKLFNALPKHLRAYLPIDEDRELTEQFGEYIGYSDHQFSMQLQEIKVHSGKVPLTYRSLIFGTNCTMEEWARLANEYPSLALAFWSEDLWAMLRREKPSILKEDPAARILAQKLVEQPSAIRSRPLLWAEMLNRLPSTDAMALWAAIRSIDGEIIEPERIRNSFDPTFKLSLPYDAVFLPQLVTALVNDVESLVRRFDNRAEMIKAYIGKLFHSEDELLHVWSTVDISLQNRIAALFLWLLHSGTKLSLEQYAGDIIKSYQDEFGTWYVQALFACIICITSNEDAAVDHMIGSLLEMTRSNYKVRRLIEEFIAPWRERSLAPVSRLGVAPAWLKA